MNLEKILILTDHSNHSAENSLYALSVALYKHNAVHSVYVASRGTTNNHAFFSGLSGAKLWGLKVDEHFAFSKEGTAFMQNLQNIDIETFRVVWLRLPPPIELLMVKQLEETFRNALFVNNPHGIYETGSKAFILNFPTIIPRSHLVQSFEDLRPLLKENLVLKPLRSYGGLGIVKIENRIVEIDRKQYPITDYLQGKRQFRFPVLAVQYLPNVSKGDKRIVVLDGQIMGASLRKPPKNSWLCNVSMGGTAEHTTITEAERNIIETINPTLERLGIFMYGVDTLENDAGIRVLSELNTTSIGGLPQIGKYTGRPTEDDFATLFISYVQRKLKNERKNS